MKSVLKYFLFSLLLIVIDQSIKYWVYKNMFEGRDGEISIIGNFFKLHYVTNPGMAFGFTIPFKYGKVFLSVFRLIAMFLISFYLYYLHKNKFSQGLIWCVAAILAGAIGNLFDSIFYGVLLGNAAYDAPTPWFYGEVIDMFFFDLYSFYIPEWIPYFGGAYCSTPIFNFADACIFCGVVTILIFQARFFIEPEGEILNGIDLDETGNIKEVEEKNSLEDIDNQLNTKENDKED